jgi:hypothetical protein
MDDKDPSQPIVDAVRYLRNNQSGKDYPPDRCLGLPLRPSPCAQLRRLTPDSWKLGLRPPSAGVAHSTRALNRFCCTLPYFATLP